MRPTVPEVLINHLTTQYGEALAQEITAGFDVVRPVTLRVNPLRSSMEEVLSQLDAAGIVHESVPWFSDALILPESREDALRALPVYENGGIYLQSLSSMLPVLVMQPQPGENILDMAAAPGGKTTQIAAMTGGKAQLTACERNAIRADRLRFNLERQGVRRANVMNQDARQLDDFFSFDRVLLDAPCTGSGTILLGEDEPQRRMDESWIKKTAATQSAMLSKALRLLRRGHTMVYSTCSILDIENDSVVEKAIRDTKAQLVPVDPSLTAQLPTLPTRLKGTLCVKPTRLFEGFYVAMLRKP